MDHQGAPIISFHHYILKNSELAKNQWSRNMPDMPDMSGRLLLMSGRELRPCRTFCPAGLNTHKMFDKENKNDHWRLPVIIWEECLTGAQNVRQSAEGLPDILSSTPEIIFAITEKLALKWTKTLADLHNFGIYLFPPRDPFTTVETQTTTRIPIERFNSVLDQVLQSKQWNYGQYFVDISLHLVNKLINKSCKWTDRGLLTHLIFVCFWAVFFFLVKNTQK